MVRDTPTDKPGPEQHSPLDRHLHLGKKEKLSNSNKSNKGMWESGWGASSAEDWGKGTLPGTVNKQAGRSIEQPGVEKLVRVAEGGKLHRRGGKSHFPREL
jgi:hypothetical protein